jgi:hypothetical protein
MWHSDPMAGLVLPAPDKGAPGTGTGTGWQQQHHSQGLDKWEAADAKAAAQQQQAQQQAQQQQQQGSSRPEESSGSSSRAAWQQQQQHLAPQQQQQGSSRPEESSGSPPVWSSRRLRVAGAALPRLDTHTSAEFDLPPVLHTHHSGDVGLPGEQQGHGQPQWQGEGHGHAQQWEEQGCEAGDIVVSGGFAAERAQWAAAAAPGAGQWATQRSESMGAYGAASNLPSPWSVDAGIWSAGGAMLSPQPFWSGGSGRGLPTPSGNTRGGADADHHQGGAPGSSSGGDAAALASLWRRASDAVDCSATADAAAAAAAAAAPAAAAGRLPDSPVGSSGSWEAISAAAAHLLSAEPLSSPTAQGRGHDGAHGADETYSEHAAMLAAAQRAELQDLHALLLLSQQHGDFAALGSGGIDAAGAAATAGGSGSEPVLGDLLLLDGQLQAPLDGDQLAQLASLLAQLHGDAAASAAAAAAAQYSDNVGGSSMRAMAGEAQPQSGVQSTRCARGGGGPQQLPEAARQLLAALAGGVWQPTAPPTPSGAQQAQQAQQAQLERGFSGGGAVFGLAPGPPATPRPATAASASAPPLPEFLLPGTAGTTAAQVPAGATLIGPGGVPHTIGPDGRAVPMVAAQLPGGAIVMVPASALVHPAHAVPGTHGPSQLPGGPQMMMLPAGHGGTGVPAHAHLLQGHGTDWQHGPPPTPGHSGSRRRGAKSKAKTLTSSVVKVMHDGGAKT